MLLTVPFRVLLLLLWWWWLLILNWRWLLLLLRRTVGIAALFGHGPLPDELVFCNDVVLFSR